MTLFITSRVIDLCLSGFEHSKAVLAVSQSAQLIAKRIMQDLARGVTVIPAVGGFSGQSCQMVFCVVRASQIASLKRIIAETDESAFTAVVGVAEVMGEGFTNI